MSNFSIATAQLNFVVGDMQGNARKIIDAAAQAAAQGAQLLLTPELAICGYAAQDLFQRPSFLAACDAALQAIVEASTQWPQLALVVGHPEPVQDAHRSCYNSATVLQNGQVLAHYRKQELPNYREFDEKRYFVAGQQPCVFDVAGTRIGLLICEDAWYAQPAAAAKAAGAQMLAVINASPFHMGKPEQREHTMAERVRETGLPLVYAHLVGGQDELVFDGHSFAMNADGAVAARAPGFAEKLLLTHANRAEGAINFEGDVVSLGDTNSQLWHALVLSVRDYLGKTGFPGALLGLSGGIDSALVLAIAVDAIGAANVRTVMMPSPYTADISWIDARDMAERLSVQYEEISIAPQFEAFKAALAHDFAGKAEDTTEENLQARIRGTLLMALSNKFGSIVLTTGNKSEMATGYCTLYGDMAGGFAVLRDVLKTRVFELARWRNANDPFGTGLDPIPDRIITRPPSAELRADQKDEDSLPPYPVLDTIITRYMEQDAEVEAIIGEGFQREDVERVVRLIRINEYKRRQAAVGPRLSPRGFGKDWRYPITNRYRG